MYSVGEPASSTPSAKPIFIELCAGSANLSFAFKGEGFHSIPVDHSRNEHRSRLPTVILDLSVDHQSDIIINVLQSGNVQAIWAGVPCGTASRAREIRLPGKFSGPPPLRSAEFPLGLPGLRPVDQLKVSKANSIYANVSRILDVAINLNIIVCIENPRNSWLWEIHWCKTLLDRNFCDSVFQHCKWNTKDTPSRAKWTRIRSNWKPLQQLSGICSVGHTHLTWGVTLDGSFATRGEAEYSANMCWALAQVISKAVASKGIFLEPLSLNPDILTTSPHKRRRAS